MLKEWTKTPRARCAKILKQLPQRLRRDRPNQPIDVRWRAKISIMASEEWSVIFYTDARDRSPVEEFLRQLDQRTYNRFLWSIEQLRMRNVQAREPLVRHLGGRLWELRRESNTNIYRILYTFLQGRRILLLHGFQKKTQRTPRADLVIAQQRLAELMGEEGGAV